MRSAWILGAVFAVQPACSSTDPSGDDDDAVHDAGDTIDARGGINPDAAPQSSVVRFIVMGDTGEGNEDQAMVAAVIEDKCDAEGCDFVILLGDNIYDSGVDSTSDPQWQTKFEEPYKNLDMPFYAVMGNHDYGGRIITSGDTGGLGNEFDKGPLEVMYSDLSDKWEMPATFYTFTRANVGFIMLDTNSIMWADTTHGDQDAWYATAMMEVSNAEWLFAAGHHTYLSNGAHGNAGNYESIEVAGIEIPNPVPLLNGGNVKTFFDTHVCGTVDVYFCGHDHNRQWINEPTACGGTELIVSGAGAKVKEFSDPPPNEVYFADAVTEGFMYVVVDGNTMTSQFIDKTGNVDFERILMR